MLDMKALMPEFVVHVASKTDDEVQTSIQNAERLTAGCADRDKKSATKNEEVKSI